jgi:SAM-dependent methyltransferase
MSQLQIDAAGITHWESSYAASKGIAKGWEPYGYTAKTLENILLKALAQSQPDSILEVGCGNSSWLPYLGKRTGASVSGLDYSASGCKLAEANLAAEQVEGTIYHGDLFSPPENLIGQFDFVYSLGVVEHFSDTDGVIMALKRFVRPGGWLLTEIPNLKGSFHGLLTHFWQPGIFFKHVPLNSDDLSTAYERCGLSQVEAGYAGLFSLNIVAWGKEPRWPQAEKTLLPLLYPTVRLSERVLAKVKNYKSPIHFLAPFIYATGRVEN